METEIKMTPWSSNKKKHEIAGKNPVRWLPVMLWTGVMLTLSSIPGPQLPPVGPLGIDKLVHFSEYAVFSFLLMRAGYSGENIPGLNILLLTAFLFACADELHQLFIPGRECDIFDLTADSLGIGLGWFVQLRFNRYMGKNNDKLHGKSNRR